MEWQEGVRGLTPEEEALRELVDGVAYLCVTAWQLHVMAEGLARRRTASVSRSDACSDA